MKLAMTYCKVYVLELMRNRTSLFFTLLFPALLMLMISDQHEANSIKELAITIVFCNYAVQTIALQVLGMNISNSRHSDWSLFLRTLPVSAASMFAGRILSMLVFAFISMALIILLHILIHHGELTSSQWIFIMVIALLGGIPMALLGIALGYSTNPATSRGAFVLVNLLFLFGAFSLPDHGFLSYARIFIPTYQWMMISLNFLTNSSTLVPWLWMLAYTVIFYFLAVAAYKYKRNTRLE